MEENMKRLNGTLIGGRDSAKKLQNLLRRRLNNDGTVSVEDLLMEILRSFSDGLSLLRSCDSGELSGVSAAGSGDQLPVSNTGKRSAPGKERRGCYKRRRTIDSRVKTSDTIEDGFAWRKYGQKMILNSKSPRCYYRCTHKNEHGCKALKQVQKVEEESKMYQITYFGHHTCPSLNTFSHSRLIIDFNASKNHSSVTNSPSTITNTQVESSIKQEVDSKAQSSDDVSSVNDSHTFPSLEWNELLMDDEVTPFMCIEDSCASTSPHGYLDMDFLNNLEFSRDFLLDDQYFPRLI